MSENLKEELSELSKKVESLATKNEGQKKRDKWDKLQILASFISSILFAGVGLYFTTVYNNREAKRQEDLQNANLSRADREETRQIEMQNIQKDISQLEAIIRLTPLLTSKDRDTKHYALMTLQALYENKNALLPYKTTTDTGTVQHKIFENKNIEPNQTSSLDLLSGFAKIALAENASFMDRKEAMKNVRDIAINPASSQKIKEEATGIMTQLAISEKVPDNIRQVARDYLKDIVSLPRDSFASHINKEPADRKVEEIILHHTYQPAIKNYKGQEIINSMVKFHVENNNWSYAGWHFMISPDGLIWTGRPININWTGVTGYRNQAISVTLLLNGDEELPTDEQRKSLVTVINVLCKRFNIDPKYNFSSNRGFHRDHNSRTFAGKTCPGNLITKEMVLSWLNGNDKEVPSNSEGLTDSQKITRTQLLSKLKKLIADKLGIDLGKIQMETNFTSDLGADELDFVELIMEIEKEFKVSIVDDQAEKLTTVKTAFDFLVKELKL